MKKDVHSSIEVIESIVIMGARDNECAKSRIAVQRIQTVQTFYVLR